MSLLWQHSLRADLGQSDADKAALRGDVQRAAVTIAGLEQERVGVGNVKLVLTPHFRSDSVLM